MKKNHAVAASFQEISKQSIIEDLKKVGVEEGDHLAVVLSLKSIGYVAGGPKAFIEALLRVVGPNGTIMMNTHTHGFPLSEIPLDYVYDCEVTPCWTGAVPETLRKWPNAIRSKNPITSVTAVGRLAEYLTEGHDEHANLYAPYSRLAAVNGKYLCIGLKDNLVAIRHEAHHLTGLDDVVKMFFGAKYVDDSGKVRLYVYNHPPCAANLPHLVPKLKSLGILKTGKIGYAKAYFASARQLLDSMAEMLRFNPSLTLCDRILCLWCSEAQTKLDLVRTNEGTGFQKNLFSLTVRRFINKFFFRRFLFLSFESGRGYTRFRPTRTQMVTRMIKNFLHLCFLAVVDLVE